MADAPKPDTDKAYWAAFDSAMCNELAAIENRRAAVIRYASNPIASKIMYEALRAFIGKDSAK